jgi:hypothetical protein
MTIEHHRGFTSNFAVYTLALDDKNRVQQQQETKRMGVSAMTTKPLPSTYSVLKQRPKHHS